MKETILFEQPILLIGFIVAFLFTVFALKYKQREGMLFPLLGLLVFAVTSVYALLLGMSMQELLLITCFFFLADLIATKGRGNV